MARIEVLYADDSARQRWSYFVFDIGGNKYRLIAAVHFNRQMVFIRLPTKTVHRIFKRYVVGPANFSFA